MNPMTMRLDATGTDLRTRFVAALACGLFLVLLPGLARGQDSEITVTAPIGGGAQIWVDMNPTGNTATSVASIQRCKKVDAANARFDVDVVVFNAPAFQKLLVTLTFDSAYVRVITANADYNLLRNGGTTCNGNPWWVTGNTVTIYQMVTAPYGGSGTGVLARITFEGKTPFGQSGFDVTYADLYDGASTPCFNGIWNLLTVSRSDAIGQAYIDPAGIVGCWTVTSTGDAADLSPGDGVCDVNPAPGIVESTLRAAIQEANAISGANRVSFRIANEDRACGPPCVIACLDLPALSDATGGTTLDGTTHPAIELDAVGGTTDGLRLTSANNVVKSLTIKRAAASGIKINTANGNKILGCKIGTNHNGIGGARNTANGIEIVNGSNNEIGGVNGGEGNLIVDHSNAGKAGIRITGGSGNLIRGNTIGLDAAGARLPNIYGILLSASNGNTIGGAVVAARNVISGNTQNGIFLTGASANNVIQGNYIGTDPTGTLGRFNGTDGIALDDAANTTIGGPTGLTGTPPGNLISGNTGRGIYIHLTTSTGNLVKGNLIGLDANGNFFGNGQPGVSINNARDNTIGGVAAADGNTISNNGGAGVEIQAGSTGNKVQGNIIGMDRAGLAARANGRGVLVNDSPNNTIGGSTAVPGTAPGNLISGNAQEGVFIVTSSGQGGNTVAGNVIGLDAAGFVAKNWDYGVRIQFSPNNVIGGATANERNVISGNGTSFPGGADPGVIISGAGGNQILYNYIGTNVDGVLARPNAGDGVWLSGTGSVAASEPRPGSLISDDVNDPPKATALAIAPGVVIADNVISGNLGDGIAFVGAGTANNTVIRNAIGTNAARNLRVPNTGAGVSISGGAHGNLIGTPNNGNVISGNLGSGVEISGAGTTGNLVRSNLIGLDGSGNDAISNYIGVEIHLGAQFNEVGGTYVDDTNVISGNDSAGVQIADPDTDNNNVKINTIGTDVSRDTAVPNHASGVYIRNGARFNTVVDNAIEGNTPHGVHIQGNILLGSASRNDILSNFIGSLSLPNVQDGIHIGPMAELNQVSLNAIGNNDGDGIEIQGPDADGNMVFGNSSIGHGGSGVRIADNASFNIVGGFIPASRNFIRGNTLDGITIKSGTGNALYENSISLNGGLGIDLDNDGVTANDGAPDPDLGANDLQNCPVLTSASAGAFVTTVAGTLTSLANTVFRIEFFVDTDCDTSGSGEGNTFLDLAFVTTDGTGTAAINHVIPGAFIGAFMTATATDTVLHNTSEFSACLAVAAGPGAPADLAIQNGSVALPSAPRLFAAAFDTVVVGDTLSYHLVAINQGAGGATGVAVTDTLPSGVTFVSSVSSQGTCTGTSIVSCDVGAVAADDSVTVTIKVIPNTAGTIVNVAEVYGTEMDPDTTNNVSRDTTVVVSPPTGVKPRPVPISRSVWLGQNIPNPFNPTTRIPFSLPGAAVVRLSIYDVRGQLVRVLVSGPRPAGEQEVVWDGLNRSGNMVATGTYFYALDTPWGGSRRRMLLLK